MYYNSNPFNILGVSVYADRREIVSACDDKVLILGDEVCNEARSTLTTPSKRLYAEMRWFPDCTDVIVGTIKDYCNDSSKLEDVIDELAEYSELSKLNACLVFFENNEYVSATGLKTDILRISRLYESLDASSIQSIINDERLASGFPQIDSITEIQDNIRNIKQEIKQIIDKRLNSLTKSSYVYIVTSLAESYSNGRAKGQAVLDDIISSYNINISNELEVREKAIIKMAGFISQSVGKINIERAISDLINDLFSWDTIAQPLQLGTMAKGISHENSQNVLNALRALAISLHNDHQMTDLSIKLTTAMKKVFAELPEDISQIDEDEKTLIKLKNDGELSKLFEDFVNRYINKFSSYSNYQLPSAVDSLLNRVEELNEFIIKNCSNAEQRAEARTALCIATRSVAIDIHNKRDNCDLSLKIITFLINKFSDISELDDKLRVDKQTLQKNKSISNNRSIYSNSSSNSTSSAPKDSPLKVLLSVIVFILTKPFLLLLIVSVLVSLFSSCG